MSIRVNILNRTKLIVDNNSEFVAKAAASLKKAGIAYEMLTKRFRNYSPHMMRSGMCVDYGISQATMNPVDNVYTYTIWVSRKNLKDAKWLLGI